MEAEYKTSNMNLREANSEQLILTKLAPRVLTGILSIPNKGAADWGWQSLLAYGCQNTVVVVDTINVQILVTMEKHRSSVVKVKWAHENYHHDLSNPYNLCLASADTSGNIVIWNVVQACHKTILSDGNRAVQEMEWLSSSDTSYELLVALHPPYSLILWNTETGSKLWKKNYTESLLSFAFDPFDYTNLAFLAQDCIVFVDDFSVIKLPSSNGRKFYISSPGSATLDNKTRNTIKKKMRLLVSPEIKQRTGSNDSEITLSECQQLMFHKACRHHLLLVYPREILILDLEINQTVGIVTMERSGSPFLEVFSCKQRDVLMCLHENGGITVRVRRQMGSPHVTSPIETQANYDQTGSPDFYSDVWYDLRCQSDAMRITKHNRVFSMACCPITEKKIALVMSDGRVLLWELKAVDQLVTNQVTSPLYSPGTNQPFPYSDVELSGSKVPYISNAPYPKTCLSDLISPAMNQCDNRNKHHNITLKFILTGLLCGLSAPPFVIRMCPPLTTKNWKTYQPLLAVGTSFGSIQVYNLSTGMLWREYNILTCAVRGIEWASLRSFLTYAYPTPGSSGLVKNELLLVDIQTGKSKQLRMDKNSEESPIEMIRISHLKQYFIVVFKDKPFELWDMKTLSVLRQMPRKFPVVTALEWSPTHSLKNLKKKLAHETASGSSCATSFPDVTVDPTIRGDSAVPATNLNAREHFVFTDNEGQVYHFIVEGSTIKDGSKLTPDGSMAIVSYIAWKGDLLVMGDVDGNLTVWDLKARVSRVIPTHRGKILKARFAPGRGNLKLLILGVEGVDILDIKTGELVSHLRCPRDITKILDVEWASSDKPSLATIDGCIRVMDIKLKLSCSTLADQDIAEALFCPYLLSPKTALNMKYLLQHQPWNQDFALELTDIDDPAKENIENNANQQLNVMDSSIREYLPHCFFGIAQRCLLVARLFGDESDLNFWTVVLHYLRVEKAYPICKGGSKTLSQADSGDLFVPSQNRDNQDIVIVDSKKLADRNNLWEKLKDRPLDTSFDLLCDNQTFLKYQLDRVTLHDSKRATYDHTRKCVENLMLLGQTDRVVQLLLETEADNDNYYADALRACLVATIRSSGASQSTIKLVATNLIANGKISEGVQLLCLIDKGLDACRYLQSYGQWSQAAWLAKATLDYSECVEVMKRWVDHLSTPVINQKSKAVLVLISLGQFVKAIEMLFGFRCFDRATLLIEACLEFGVLEKTEETTPLIEAVFLEYARLLNSLGNCSAAVFYCGQAGMKGQQLHKEWEILSQDK